MRRRLQWDFPAEGKDAMVVELEARWGLRGRSLHREAARAVMMDPNGWRTCRTFLPAAAFCRALEVTLEVLKQMIEVVERHHPGWLVLDKGVLRIHWQSIERYWTPYQQRAMRNVPEDEPQEGDDPAAWRLCMAHASPLQRLTGPLTRFGARDAYRVVAGLLREYPAEQIEAALRPETWAKHWKYTSGKFVAEHLAGVLKGERAPDAHAAAIGSCRKCGADVAGQATTCDACRIAQQEADERARMDPEARRVGEAALAELRRKAGLAPAGKYSGPPRCDTCGAVEQIEYVAGLGFRCAQHAKRQEVNYDH